MQGDYTSIKVILAFSNIRISSNPCLLIFDIITYIIMKEKLNQEWLLYIEWKTWDEIDENIDEFIWNLSRYEIAFIMYDFFKIVNPEMDEFDITI